MTTSLHELSSQYFKALPIFSGKKDSEALQHPIFTFGQLKEVLAAFDKAKELTKNGSEENMTYEYLERSSKASSAEGLIKTMGSIGWELVAIIEAEPVLDGDTFETVPAVKIGFRRPR